MIAPRIWFWVPAIIAAIAFFVGAWVGLAAGAWSSALHFAIIGGIAGAIAIGLRLSFSGKRPSN
jgi:hypothetical protein